MASSDYRDDNRYSDYPESRRENRRVSFRYSDTPPPRPPPPNFDDSSFIVPETPSFSRSRSDSRDYVHYNDSYHSDSRRRYDVPYHSIPYSDYQQSRQSRVSQSAYGPPSIPERLSSRNSFNDISMVPRSHNRREKEPEKFDGKSVDWKDYIVQFEQVAAWNNWTEFEKAQQLSMSLRGTAQKLLGDLDCSVVNDYTLLKSMLAQRFNPKERVTASRCEFAARKRKTGENLYDFGYALRRLVRLAYPDGEYNSVLEQLVINQFINGLCHTDMERHVQFSHPETLEEAIASATEYEAFTSAQNVPRKPKEENCTIRAVNRENKVGKDKDEKQSQANENASSQNDSLKDMFKSFSDCFDKMNEKLDQMSNFTRNKRNLSSVECWNCKRKGHIAKYCRFTEEKDRSQNDKKVDSEKVKN